MKTFLILACLATCAFADYCSMPSCDGKPHIACQNNWALSKDCPSGARVVQTTPALIKTIVDEHNKCRDIVASGKLDGYKPASCMGTMQYSDDLARMAALNVKRCLFQHDQCRTTVQFSQSGQNLHKSHSSEPIPDNITNLVKNGINSWYMEHKLASMADIDKCPSDRNKIGHFTAMVIDKNVYVGCGFVKMPPNPATPKRHTLLMACNYSAINVSGQKTYASSTVPASGCKNKNPLYPNLCAVGEAY